MPWSHSIVDRNSVPDAVVPKLAHHEAPPIVAPAVMIGVTLVLKVVVLVAALKCGVPDDHNMMLARWHESPVVKVALNSVHHAVVIVLGWNHRDAAPAVTVRTLAHYEVQTEVAQKWVPKDALVEVANVIPAHDVADLIAIDATLALAPTPAHNAVNPTIIGLCTDHWPETKI